MKKRYFIYFINFIIVSFLLMMIISLSILTFNDKLRRSIFSKFSPTVHTIYMQFLNRDMRKKNFTNASNRIIQEINLSKKFLSNKNSMHKFINKQIEFIIENAVEQKDYDDIQNLLELFLQIDPDVYLLNVAYAQALSNDDLEKSINVIKKTIEISEIHQEAYRLGIELALKYNDDKLLTEICERFKKSNFGGEQPTSHNTFFGSYTNNQLAIKFHEDDNGNFYPFENIQLNSLISMEIIPMNKIIFGGLDIFISAIPGLKFKISNLKIYKDEKIYENLDNVVAYSNYAYIKRTDSNEIIVSIYGKKQHKISLLNKNKIEFDKIEIDFFFEKINFFPKKICFVK